MCNSRNSTRIPLWFEDIDLKKSICVDKCMANLILELRNHIDTLACCCGHGRYDISIVYKSENGEIKDLISNKEIPRVRKFYRKDKQGYYYIPEVIKVKK